MSANENIGSFAGTGLELLTTSEMYAADAAAVASGTPSHLLMENAGRAIVKTILDRWSTRPVSILCGPGNNGGDGFVAARLLASAGWPVKLALLGEVDALKGDAAKMAALWDGVVEPLNTSVLEGAELFIDALFGAGLTRLPDSTVTNVIAEINKRKTPCVAVDLPSGINGNSGEVLDLAPNCVLTVTFFRRKPGHLLYPAREYCGDVLVADIGIDENVLPAIGSGLAQNSPSLWVSGFPSPTDIDHKYSRGYVLIGGGAKMTGAARLAARAAARVGAGMVGIAAPSEAMGIYAADDPSFLIHQMTDINDFMGLLGDSRLKALVLGPGRGVNSPTAEMTLAALVARKSVVLDADALTVFEDQREKLFDAAKNTPVVMTPHEGEFSRLFDFKGDKLSRCRAAAALANAVILLKGPDTVIAAPDGRAVINANAPPTLATAGAGDVLAGLIGGLLAQGTKPFTAACAACWIHGEAATRFGPGLIASDLPQCVPPVLKELFRAT